MLKQVLYDYQPVTLYRMARSGSPVETIWKVDGTNGELHTDTKLKKIRISIGEFGYEVWAVKAAVT